jgi:hypothetical protein
MQKYRPAQPYRGRSTAPLASGTSTRLHHGQLLVSSDQPIISIIHRISTDDIGN